MIPAPRGVGFRWNIPWVHTGLRSLLGEGGMGKVYRALDTRLDRPVAIKISARQFNPRFEREGPGLFSGAESPPNICSLFDVGVLPSGGAFLVTELVEGESLRVWLAREPGLERALAVFRQVVEALRRGARCRPRASRPQACQHYGPFPDGYAKVLDFGLGYKRVRSGRRVR